MSQSLQALLARAQVWNGSAWVNAPGDAANGLDVDVTRSALPTGASTETTLAGVKTGTDKIPASPAQEHATAASPHSARLSDGASYIGSTAQRLHVDDGGSSLTVDGSVTADTELPAAAALADNVVNPTTPLAGAAGMVWNPDIAQWQRARAAPNSGEVTRTGIPFAAMALWRAADAFQTWGVMNGLGDGDFGNNMGRVGLSFFNGSTYDRARGDTSGLSVHGDVDHDAANTLKNEQIAGHASPVDVPPAAVSAAGDRVRAWMDRYGAVVTRDRKIRETYTAVFRLAETAARLDQTFTQVANTTKQWATLHHTVAASTKEVRLQKCVVWITGWTVAVMQAVLELRQISAAPATGNPAITPTPRRRGGTAAEAVALYLPTTAGTEANANSPLAHIAFDYGIMGAVSTVNPLAGTQYGPGALLLYDSSQEDDEAMQPVLPVGALDGWAVCLRSVGAPVVRLTCMMVFTEEIP